MSEEYTELQLNFDFAESDDSEIRGDQFPADSFLEPVLPQPPVPEDTEPLPEQPSDAKKEKTSDLSLKDLQFAALGWLANGSFRRRLKRKSAARNRICSIPAFSSRKLNTGITKKL